MILGKEGSLQELIYCIVLIFECVNYMIFETNARFGKNCVNIR